VALLAFRRIQLFIFHHQFSSTISSIASSQNVRWKGIYEVVYQMVSLLLNDTGGRESTNIIFGKSEKAVCFHTGSAITLSAYSVTSFPVLCDEVALIFWVV